MRHEVLVRREAFVVNLAGLDLRELLSHLQGLPSLLLALELLRLVAVAAGHVLLDGQVKLPLRELRLVPRFACRRVGEGARATTTRERMLT